jgi:hypothetical protein
VTHPPGLEFGCFAAVLGPQGSGFEGEALLRIDTGVLEISMFPVLDATCLLARMPEDQRALASCCCCCCCFEVCIELGSQGKPVLASMQAMRGAAPGATCPCSCS